MTNPHDQRSRLDAAIDASVRRMMHVDPRPGLSRRVLQQLHASPQPTSRWRIGWLPVAVSLGLLVLVMGGAMWYRAGQPPRPQPSVALKMVFPPPDFPAAPVAPDTARSEAPAAAAAPPSPSNRARVAEPDPATIFGGERGRVRAADAGAISGETRQPSPPVRLELLFSESDASRGHGPVYLTLASGERGHVRIGDEPPFYLIDAAPEVLGSGGVRVRVKVGYSGEVKTADVALATWTKEVSADIARGATADVAAPHPVPGRQPITVRIRAEILK